MEDTMETNLKDHPASSLSGREGKVAFCFPGQGSLAPGMGREVAEAIPDAMDVYRVGSQASGLDLQRLGSMAAILGLEDEAVENLCRKIIGVWPANYNCPGQIVVSGENSAVEECCAEAESLGARRAIRLKVSGAFHSPLVARAADRL